MAGLMNATQQPAMPPQAAPSPAQQPQGKGPAPLSDPILQQIQDGIKAKVQPALRNKYMQIVTAGMAIMFSPQTGPQVMQKIKNSQDPATDIAAGVNNIIAMVFNQVATKSPPAEQQAFVAAAGPAAVTLMCQCFDAWEKITGQKVTSEVVAECTKDTTQGMMEKFHITSDMIRQAVQSKNSAPPNTAAAAQPQPTGM